MDDEVKLGLGTKEVGDPEPVDYSKILGNNRILFVNDSHTSFTDKEAFKNALARLAEGGVTDLALEMLPMGFDTSDPEKVRHYLQDHWDDKGPGMGDKYFEIYSLAKSLGMKTHGLDISNEEYLASGQSATFGQRNRQWAEIIKTKLEEDLNTRVVVFCGGSHSGYYPARDRANNILEDLGYQSSCARYFGGDNNSPFLDEEKLMQGLIKSRDPGANFMVEFKSPRRLADYIIYPGKLTSA